MTESPNRDFITWIVRSHFNRMIPSTAVVTSVMGFYHTFNFWVLIESVILPLTLDAFWFFYCAPITHNNAGIGANTITVSRFSHGLILVE